MDIQGNIDLKGEAQIVNLRVGNSATAPQDLSSGDLWFDTTDKVYKGWDGVKVVTIYTPDTAVSLLPGTMTVSQFLEFSVGNSTKTLDLDNLVKKSGDIMTGSLSLPSIASKGLLVEEQYTWMDILGDVTPKDSGVGRAVLANYIGNIKGWAHSATSTGDLQYHLPHDYAPGTDLYLHVHWGHNGTNIAGNFVVSCYMTYAKGHGQVDSIFTTPVQTTLTVGALNIGNSPQYCHRVDEIKVSQPLGSQYLLDTNKLEIDGLVKVYYAITEIPSITGSVYQNLPYIFTIDVHAQSRGIGTINKAPNFYGA